MLIIKNKTDKEIAKQVKEFRAKLLYEEEQKARLLSKKLDYSYLEFLLEKCENNPDLIIEIETADHSHLTIKTNRKHHTATTSQLFEGADIE